MHASNRRLIAGVFGPLELCPIGTTAKGFRVRHSRSSGLHVGLAGLHLLCEGGGDQYEDVHYKYVVSNEVGNFAP